MAMSTSQAQASSLRLQKILLSWDYWDLETCTEEGSGAIKELHKVPDTFSSIQVCPNAAHYSFCRSVKQMTSVLGLHFQEYISVFEPLVLEECGALLLRGNEEASNMNPHQAVVAVTSTVCFSTQLTCKMF